MRQIVSKILARGLSLGNIASYGSWQCLRVLGAFWGTLRFRLKAWLFGVRAGRNVRVHGTIGLMRWPGSRIEIGDNVSVVSSWRRATACALSHPARLRTFGPEARIIIGEGCELSGTSVSCRSTSVILGRRVLIAPDVIITDSDFHALWPVEQRAEDPGMDRDRPVYIGDGAWIGMRCIILKGVTIGSGAIIGAGSVVTRDIPDNAVACGFPARVVRQCDAMGNLV